MNESNTYIYTHYRIVNSFQYEKFKQNSYCLDVRLIEELWAIWPGVKRKYLSLNELIPK